MGESSARATRSRPADFAAYRARSATFETLGERLPSESADHIAAQLPPELGRHLKNRHFEHLSLRNFNERVAAREHRDVTKASFHARCVLDTLTAAISEGAVRKIRHPLPAEFQPLLGGVDGP